MMRSSLLQSFAKILPLLLLMAVSACSAVDKANDHLASMDETTQKLTISVTDDQKYLKSFSEQLELMQEHTDRLESEFEADREYIKTVAECMKSLSDSLNALQKIGDSAFHVVLEALLKPASPDPKTPDADDLLPAPAPSVNPLPKGNA